jgi:hypothetical protein
VSSNICVCMFVCMYLYMYMYVCFYICICPCICACVYVYVNGFVWMYILIFYYYLLFILIFPFSKIKSDTIILLHCPAYLQSSLRVQYVIRLKNVIAKHYLLTMRFFIYTKKRDNWLHATEYLNLKVSRDTVIYSLTMYLCLNVYMHMYVYLCARMYVYVHVCMCMWMGLYECTYLFFNIIYYSY